jgi:integrase
MTPSKQLEAEDVERARLTDGKKLLKLSDGAGLFLLVERRSDGTQSKGWRFRYSRENKDTMLSLGLFPAVSLEQARSKAQAARSMLTRGQDPQELRQAEKSQRWLEQEKTYGIVASEYNGTQAHRSAKTIERCERMYRHSAKLHNKTFAQLDRPTLLQCCRVLESDGKSETAHRLGIYFSAVFRYARDEGYFKGTDPTVGGFGKSLKPVQEQHQAALTEPRQVGALMRVLTMEWLFEGARGPTTPSTLRALELLMRTCVRPGELRQSEWSEFDLTGKRHDGHPTWRIPVAKMKVRDGNRTDHIVPLSRQALAVLEAQHAVTGHAKYVFPNARTDTRPLTDAALSAAMIALGYKDQHVPHGSRTTFATLARDVLKAESELVELTLAHKVGSDVRGAYDRAQRLTERRALMQSYSDLLDKLRD